MGRLLCAEEFTVSPVEMRRTPHAHLDPSWYFEDAQYETSYNRGEGWTYTPESSFPHVAAIHRDAFDVSMKIEIRRLVERRMLGSVYYRNIDMTYDYVNTYKNKKKIEKYKSKVRHGYHVFYFEERDDLVLFQMQYAGLVSMIEKRHPDFDEVTEAMIEEAHSFSFFG